MVAADELLSAESALSLGDSNMIDEDFENALTAYATALALIPSVPSSSTFSSGCLSFRILSHKAEVLLKLKRYDEALVDGREALTFVSSALGFLREGETELCHSRIGQALLHLQRYDEALIEFQQALQLAIYNQDRRKTKYRYEAYVQQCQSNMISTNAETEPAIQNMDFDKDESEQVLVEEIERDKHMFPEVITPLKEAYESPSINKSSTKLGSKIPSIPKYQYYQTDKIMTIAILEPDVKHTDLMVKFGTKRLTVILKKQGVDLTVICGKLYSKVVKDKCKVVIKGEKVLLKLFKSEPHEWHELFSKALMDEDDKDESDEDEKPKNAETSETTQTSATIPRPYASHRDWNAIERDLKEQEKQDKPQGEEAMNALFRQIYAKADPDTRRAMIKSYQTSGGTVLSTNWSEVKEKDYEKEREAPKGVEWKTWEGEKVPMSKN
jgi:tetratricopeptide (TPR) repeat protein